MDRTESTRIFVLILFVVLWVTGASALVSCSKAVTNQRCELPPRYEVGQKVLVDSRLICTVQEFLKVECGKGWYRVSVNVDYGRAGAPPPVSHSITVDTTRMQPYLPEC